MEAKTSGDRDIIPAASMTVKNVVSAALVGIPAQCVGYGVTVSSDMTAEEFEWGFNRIFEMDRAVTVRLRFAAGDMWNWLHRSIFTSVRSRFMKGVRQKFTNKEDAKAYLRRLRECGWVAHKWEPRSRTDEYPWSYFVKHKSGEKSKRVVEGPRYFMAIARVEGSRGLFNCVGENEEQIFVRIPDPLLELE